MSHSLSKLEIFLFQYMTQYQSFPSCSVRSHHCGESPARNWWIFKYRTISIQSKHSTPKRTFARPNPQWHERSQDKPPLESLTYLYPRVFWFLDTATSCASFCSILNGSWGFWIASCTFVAIQIEDEHPSLVVLVILWLKSLQNC